MVKKTKMKRTRNILLSIFLGAGIVSALVFGGLEFNRYLNPPNPAIDYYIGKTPFLYPSWVTECGSEEDLERFFQDYVFREGNEKFESFHAKNPNFKIEYYRTTSLDAKCTHEFISDMRFKLYFIVEKEPVYFFFTKTTYVPVLVNTEFSQYEIDVMQEFLSSDLCTNPDEYGFEAKTEMLKLLGTTPTFQDIMAHMCDLERIEETGFNWYDLKEIMAK